jgi:hypothetical protein
MTKYFIQEGDEYISVAYAEEKKVVINRPNGCTDSLEATDDDYVYRSVNTNGKVTVINVPGQLVYELPLLIALLAKQSNMMEPVTIVEAGKITKLFQED